MTFDEWAETRGSGYGGFSRDYMREAFDAATKAERKACAEVCKTEARQYARQAREGDNSGASDHMETAAQECEREIMARSEG